ncbi:glycosyltransferase family 2 protein [Patescibacteria group bacterium]|nr:glycosyltransferase family 2 protein [Patescibacteria group bacterium]
MSSKFDKKIKIIGITLVKDEDIYIGKVLGNVLEFCDKLIVLDNYSTDKTWGIIKKLARKHKKVRARRIADSMKSHNFIEKYAGTKTWIFGVDGDEIYDPQGLKKLRQEILDRKYEGCWRIWGHALHCVSLKEKQGLARGYLAPPAKSVTKLYNFSFLKSWKEDRAERLHGKNKKFKDKYPDWQNKTRDYKDFLKDNWESSRLRCLHLSFLKRSSGENKKQRKQRLNPTEMSSFFLKLVNFLRNVFYYKRIKGSYYKTSRYQKGRIVAKKVKEFL